MTEVCEMRVAYIESPEGLLPHSRQWQQLKTLIASENADVLLTNEMPFGTWLAAEEDYDLQNALTSVAAHEEGIVALKELKIPLVLSSRPEVFGNKLVNEGYALVNGEYCFAHQKHYLPAEKGFYETRWFTTRVKGFDVIKTPELTVGFLLCTELMFNEWARHYREQGAQLIVVPRATGNNYDQWRTAAAMAAIVSGCYVVSSNRIGKVSDELSFGGRGFAFAPDGTQISETSAENPVVSFELDLALVEKQQKQYPCYVSGSVDMQN